MKKGISFKDATAAIKAAKELVNENTVPEAQVRVRAEICSNCPKRKPATSFLSRLSVVIGAVSGKHGVPTLLSNSVCGVCKCSLLLLVPSLPENLHVDSEEEAAARPDFCWVKKKL